MEHLTDGASDDAVPFPDNHLTPFTSAVYPNPSAAEIIQLPVSPPRKLRPVRFGNGRSYVDLMDTSSCGFGQTLLTGNSGLGGFSQFPAQNAAEFSAVQQMKSEFHSDCFNLISQARILEAELSSSSDDGESSDAVEEHINRKRKRESQKSLKLYLEDMVRKLMEKQEQMHKQLIEMMEKKEQERIIREEAWKQRELERAKRDEEVRAEETSRSVTLVAFLKKLLGDDFQIPKSSQVEYPVKDEAEVHGQDPCNRRWPKSEVQALVSIRTVLDHKFLKGAKGSVWEEVADGLAKMGYIRTPKKCKEKWENINKYYKRTIDSGKARPKNYRSCSYFHELDELYKSGLLTQGTGSCVKSETESKNTEE